MTLLKHTFNYDDPMRFQMVKPKYILSSISKPKITAEFVLKWL